MSIGAKIIHKTYNHGVATGYSVMLQCKCEEQRRAKITPRDLYKKREQDASRGDFEEKTTNSNQKVLPIILLNLFLLLTTAGAVPLIPFLDVARVFGENSFRLGNLCSGVAFGIAASAKKNLDLATATQFLTEPTLPFVLDHFLFDAVHHAQGNQEVMSVHSEALSSLQEPLGCALADCVARI
jgi:hypothetical protein